MMFKYRYIALCSIILLLNSCSSTTNQRSDEVLSREQERVNYLSSMEYDLLSEMMSATMTYTHSNAIIETKEEFLTELRSGNVVYKRLNHSDVQVRLVNPDTAILNGITDALVNVGGEDQEVPLRFTIVYVRKDGNWLFEAWHSVRRPE